jgi:uroporphyrinogen-III decarboxylase
MTGGKTMLTKRQNMVETMKGGKPDRFVKGYEALSLVMTPFLTTGPRVVKGGAPVKNKWGVTIAFPDNAPGPFPVHDADHIVIKDIEHWKDYVTPPSVIFSEEDWAPIVEQVKQIDRNEYFVAPFVAPGIFEQCHYLLEITNCLTAFYTNPDEMHEIIDMIADWEVRYAEQIIKYIKPDALFHHDDWGSQISSFVSPAMFEEFLLPAYKKVYGYYKANGVQCIVHHSDSYGENLVPFMIDMGMDVWQGVMSTNDIPGLVKKYGGQLTFMGGIDNGKVDREDSDPAVIHEEVFKYCRECGPKYFIPCTTMGDPLSIYPGVYEAVMAEIDKASKEMIK